MHLAAPRRTSPHLAARKLASAALLCVGLGACDTSDPIAPPVGDLQTPILSAPPALQPAPAPAPPALMQVQLSNANSCTVHLQPSRASRSSSRLTLPTSAVDVTAGTTLSRIQILRWDGVSKQPSALIDCIVPRDVKAVQAVRDYFRRGAGSDIGRRAPESGTPMAPMLANSFYDGMECLYDSGFNDFDCVGVDCWYGGHAMRLDASVGSSAISGSSPLDAMGHPSGQYVCDNGCTLWADGIGGVGYHCPEDDEGGGDEPGGSGGGGSSGGGDNEDVCYDWDPFCKREMRAEERELVAQALTRFKSLLQMSAVDRALCEPLQSQVRTWFQNEAIWVGRKIAPTTMFSDHSAHIANGVVHIDEEVFIDAKASPSPGAYAEAIAVMLMHEAQHAHSGLSHPNERNSDGNYTDAPFSSLPVVGANPCSIRNGQ